MSQQMCMYSMYVCKSVLFILYPPDFHFSRQKTKKMPLVPLHLLSHIPCPVYFSYSHAVLYTKVMCGNVQALQTAKPQHRSTIKRSYLKSGPRLNVSVVLPIVLEKQLGLDFEVKRNSDYADHFTAHCRLIDSQSIGCNLHTSPLIRGN